MTATSSAMQLGDLALTWSRVSADLSMIDSDISSDLGLTTAVLLSLFLDARCEDDNEPPSGDPDDRRGWWADEFLTVEGDKYGSRAWLLDRSKLTGNVARDAEQYDREALAWLIADSVVASIDVAIETTSNNLYHALTLHRPGREPLSLRFAHVWEAP